MNRNQALQEAVRRWGKNASVQDAGKSRSGTEEQRKAANAKAKELRALPPSTDIEETRARRKELDRLFSESQRYRYSVGEIRGVGGIRFCHIFGRGDSWDAAFEEAKNW